ncbi:unnamed protein product, partial [Ectocarpus fasciculatus]
LEPHNTQQLADFAELHTTPRTRRQHDSMAGPTTKKQKVLTQYEQLAEVTKIVADTGEIAQIKKFAPTDATTNPSLLYKASSAPEHQDLVNDALAYGKALKDVTEDERVAMTMDKLSVNFGVEILTLVKGYVS